jgi:hypothetical protein
MRIINLFTTAALFAAIALSATPVAAQDHRERARGRAAEGQAVPRDRSGESRRAEAPGAPAAHAEAPRPSETPPVQTSRRAGAARVESRGLRDSRGAVESRRDGDSRSAWERDRYGRAVPRPQVIGPRVVRPVIVAPRIYSPRYDYGGYRGYRPGYRPYVFRPWTRLSFGILVGHPVHYFYPYPYPVPVYGYGAPVAPVYITPNSTVYGSITLELSPYDAAVFVDGEYVGQVRDFDGVGAPLNLTAGRHRVDLTAPGFEPLSFDVDVRPGQLVPYRGDMQPVR